MFHPRGWASTQNVLRGAANPTQDKTSMTAKGKLKNGHVMDNNKWKS